MNMKRVMSSVLVFVCLLCGLSGCGVKDTLVGKWYNSKEKCLDIRSDGTWKLDGSYGTGTWKILDDNKTVEFLDFYGDSQNAAIEEDELGKYIDFGHYGNFYKDSYPSDDKVAAAKAKNAVKIDPFKGIKYEVTGISPYCEISVNDQGCDKSVQKYVTYSFDKDKYANGDKAIITATLSAKTGADAYVLSKSKAEYKIKNQAEYITDLSNVDLSGLKQELSDKINASISASIGTDRLFDNDILGYCEKTDVWKSYESQIYFTNEIKIENITENMHQAYTLFLKNQKENQFSERTPYNMCSFVYYFDFSVAVNVTLRTSENNTVLKIPCKMYANITAKNIVKNQDGSIYWNNELCDFDIIVSPDGADNLISNTIMSNSDNYNISKVDI